MVSEKFILNYKYNSIELDGYIPDDSCIDDWDIIYYPKEKIYTKNFDTIIRDNSNLFSTSFGRQDYLEINDNIILDSMYFIGLFFKDNDKWKLQIKNFITSKESLVYVLILFKELCNTKELQSTFYINIFDFISQSDKKENILLFYVIMIEKYKVFKELLENRTNKINISPKYLLANLKDSESLNFFTERYSMEIEIIDLLF